MSEILDHTSSRLHAYGVFSADIIDHVSESIDRISRLSGFGLFFDVVDIDESMVQNSGILDIKPKNYDESSAMVIHLPMANPLDGNQVYQIATISRMFPGRRVIAAANPSGINKSRNQLWSPQDRALVSQGDFRFATPALEHYLTDQKNVKQCSDLRIDQIGSSLGADLAVGFALREIAQVDKQLLVEPASATKRSVLNLAKTFSSTNTALDTYVESNRLATFERVRAKQGISDLRYAIGLLRLSNIALTRGIASGVFGDNLETLLRTYDNAPDTTVMWGTDTEFGSATLESELNRVEQRANTQIGRIMVQGGKHAMVNDLALMSAAALQVFGKD